MLPGRIGQCLVTGASGFIGRVLCASLKQHGCRVRALLRRAVDGPWDTVVSGELGTGGLSADAMHEIDTVFHLAGVAHVMPPREDGDALYETTNIHGSRALVEAAIAAGVRHFVYFSSVKAMGDPGDECVDERWAVLPEDPYGLSKKEAERLLLAAGKRTGMHITVLRPALVYGPGVKGNLFRMLKTIDSGRFPPLPDAVNRRSMVHVEDVVQAALLAAEKPAAVGQTYIVTDGQDCSTRQMYEWICEALGRPVPAWTMPIGMMKVLAKVGDGIGGVRGRRFLFDSEALDKLIGSACYSSEKIQRELGFRPAWDLRSALPEIVTSLGMKQAGD